MRWRASGDICTASMRCAGLAGAGTPWEPVVVGVLAAAEVAATISVESASKFEPAGRERQTLQLKFFFMER